MLVVILGQNNINYLLQELNLKCITTEKQKKTEREREK